MYVLARAVMQLKGLLKGGSFGGTIANINIMWGNNMALAIITKFLGPSDTKEARIKATWLGGSVTVDYLSIDGSLGCEERYRQAAQELVCTINKERDPASGVVWLMVDACGLAMPDQTGYAFGIELG